MCVAELPARVMTPGQGAAFRKNAQDVYTFEAVYDLADSHGKRSITVGIDIHNASGSCGSLQRSAMWYWERIKPAR